MTEAGLLPIDPFYSFDTSAFINGRRDLYRPPTFTPIWDEIAQMITKRQVLAVDEVKREVKRKDDDVGRWVRLWMLMLLSGWKSTWAATSWARLWARSAVRMKPTHEHGDPYRRPAYRKVGVATPSQADVREEDESDSHSADSGSLSRHGLPASTR